MPGKNNKKKTVSIARIAEESGVSPMTVSRALRNAGGVKAATRNHVLRVAETLGYHRRGRVGRPSNGDVQTRPSVELVVGAAGRAWALFYSDLLTVVERELSKRGYDCIVRTCTGDYREFLTLLDALKASPACGTCLIGDFDADHLRALLDVVPGALLVDNPGDVDFEGPFESLGFHNREAARIGVTHLLRRGCKRILLVYGKPKHYFSREIEQGYRQALCEASLAYDPAFVLSTDFSADNAYDVVSLAMEQGLQFDGVFTNDEMACGIYRSLHRFRLGIPRDVAVCGCDNIPVVSQLVPPLTTVALDYRRLGGLVVEHMLADNRSLFADARIRLRPHLVVRDST